MMEKFAKRSTELELMDLPFTSKELFFTNLKEIEYINRMLGGPSLTFSILKKKLKNRTGKITVVDIGFGGGDLLAYLYARRRELTCDLSLIGVDLLPESKEYAEKYHPELMGNCKFITDDYKNFLKSNHKVDVVVAGLFCHHLPDEDVIDFFRYINRYATIGGIINDLQRSPLAYYAIKILTRLFSRSEFTKNDAPLSVLRSFQFNELVTYLQKAEVEKYSVSWHWAFRYIVHINK
jgi:2-polyprenyl-3-methyl-5-hydroxy-6-metoxy-1,4-benzoquinol methylase